MVYIIFNKNNYVCRLYIEYDYYIYKNFYLNLCKLYL